MKSNHALCMGLTLAIWTAPLLAQQPPAVQANPAPGCTATPAQLEANKKVAMEFFRTAGEARVALADPSYKQHNPAFKKRAEDNKVSDYDEFKNTFLAQAGRGGKKGGTATEPAPPPGNPFEVVAEPGKFYEVFTFDTFRVRNGKLVEHWDGAVINPPAGRGQ